MEYTKARDYIKSLTPRGILPGLTTITALCDALGNPQNSLHFIHIAGTNGKGSVGAFLESIILSNKKSLCRFVSPAVGDYLETYTYNGIPIQKELYTEAVMQIQIAAASLEEKGIFPTSFEAETAAAFLIFKKLNPDYVLLECGMGGRLDSTNVIMSPLISIITSISLDHKSFLGNTTGEIATEKAGIIKQGLPIITTNQPTDAMTAIKTAAAKKQAPLYITNTIKKIDYIEHSTEFIYKNKQYKIPLLGAYQPQNAAIAIECAQILGLNVIGLMNTVWHYRFERIGKYILDGAHNEGAAITLATSLKAYLHGSTAFICGIFRDKAYERIAEITSPYADAIFCITPPTPRGLEAQTLKNTFGKYKPSYICSNIYDAIDKTKAYDNIVIFGSLSILGEARKTLIEGIIK